MNEKLNNVEWSFTQETGCLTITGTGKMQNWAEHQERPWEEIRDEIRRVRICVGTTLESLLSGGEAVGGLMAYDMDAALPSAEIHWSVPKFDVDSNLELTDALKALGVTDVFDFDKADFSPLVDFDRFDKAVAVTQVQHAARVKVDEKGCEAAAFTAVRADAQSAAPEDLPVVEMDLNRPFAFMITGVDGLPLFLGTVNNL